MDTAKTPCRTHGDYPDTSNIHAIPVSLLDGSGNRWYNWEWRSGQKFPLCASTKFSPADKITTPEDGNLVPGASAADALADVKKYHRGLSMKAGRRAGAADPNLEYLTVLDLDYKGVSEGDLVDINGQRIPWFTLSTVFSAIEAGGYVEVSPSGMGIHIIMPGTLLPHGKKWKLTRDDVIAYAPDGVTDDQIDAICALQHDIFSQHMDGGVTMTGRHLLDDMEWQIDVDASSAWLAEFHRIHLLPDMIERQKQMELAEQKRAEAAAMYAANPELMADPTDYEGRLRDAMRVPQFQALWNTSGGPGHSEDDWALLCRLAGCFMGDRELITRAFRESSLYRPEKHDQPRRGFADFLDYRIHSVLTAAGGWDGLAFPTPVTRTATGEKQALVWPQEAQEKLTALIDTLPGLPKEKVAKKALLAHLFTLMDNPENWFHMKGGVVGLRAGGISGIVKSIGGNPTTIKQRLEQFVAAGIIAGLLQDDQGITIQMPRSHRDSLALKNTVRDVEIQPERTPAKPPRSAAKKADKGEGGVVPRGPLSSRELLTCQPTYAALCAGKREIADIAQTSGQSECTVRRHLKILVGLKLINARWRKPLISLTDYEEMAGTQAAAAREKTISHIENSRARYEAAKARFEAERTAAITTERVIKKDWKGKSKIDSEPVWDAVGEAAYLAELDRYAV